MRRRTVRAAVLSAVVLAGLLAFPSAAGADTLPTLQADTPHLRGASFTVTASGLTPDTSYTLTTDGGAFDSGTASYVFTTTSSGYLRTTISGTSGVSATRDGFDVHLVATEDPGSTLAAAHETFTDPIPSASPCPAAPATLRVQGIADGDYVVDGPHLVGDPVAARASDGTLQATITGASDLPAVVDVHAHLADNPAVGYTWSVPRAAPVFSDPRLEIYSPWQVHRTANCFAPGETIRQTNRTRNATGVTTVADAHGVAKFVVDLRPGTQAADADAVSFRGVSSGQSVQVSRVGIPGTTLYQGQSLVTQVPDPWQRKRFLVGPSPDVSAAGRTNYLFAGGCNPGFFMLRPDSSEAYVWQAFPGRVNTDSCRLTLGPGYLTVRTAAGRVIWSSGSHGTRSGNRFVVTNAQRAEIVTATQVAVWTTDFGPVTTPASAMLRPQGALHRGHSVGWGTVRFGLDRYGNVVVTRAGKVVWSKHTAGRGGIRLRMLDDGDIVLRTAHHHTVWSTHTHSPGAALEVTGAGDAAIYSERGHHLVWHTGTAI